MTTAQLPALPKGQRWRIEEDGTDWEGYRAYRLELEQRFGLIFRYWDTQYTERICRTKRSRVGGWSLDRAEGILAKAQAEEPESEWHLHQVIKASEPHRTAKDRHVYAVRSTVPTNESILYAAARILERVAKNNKNKAVSDTWVGTYPPKRLK